MGYHDPDAYYQPEAFDLTPVAEIDYSSGSYEFDTRVVWSHPERGLVTARDAGCSCPSPFEGYTTLESLDDFDFEKIEAEARKEYTSGGGYVTEMEIEDFLLKLRIESPEW